MSDSQSSPDQIKQYLDLLNQQIRQPTAMPTGTPDDGSSPSWTGLLGRALSGGQAPGYQLRGSQADTSGNRALLNFGVNMLLASGPHAVRPDLLSAAATGLQGAQESLGQDQQRAAQLAAAQYSATRQQQQDRLAALKEALPLLTLQQKAAAIAGTKPPWETGSSAAPGSGGGTYEGSIIGSEGTGKNPNSSAVGGGQFIDSTWQGFVTAHPEMFAGMSPAQAMAARNDKDFMTKAAPVAVNWLAQENAKALTAAGVQPSGASLGISHYLGAGAAAQVMKAPDNALVSSFVSAEAVKANPELANMTVGQMKARYAKTPDPAFLKPTQPGGTATATATPPPAPAPSAASTLPVPPIPPPGGGTRPTAPPPGAPAAPDVAPIAGNQFAGPGAPSGGAPRPPGPAVAGNVGAIVGGMKGAGADPTTLAPPPSSPPGGPPAAPVAPGPTTPAEAVALAQKTGQPVPIPGGQGLTALPNGNVVSTPPPAAPGAAPPTAPPPLTPATPGDVPATFEEYQRQHPIVVPPEMQALFKTGPNADALAILKQQEQGYRSEWLQAKADMDPAAMAKATEAINTVRAKQAELLQGADKQGGDAQAQYFRDQTNVQKEIWLKLRETQAARDAAEVAAQRQLDRELKLKQVEGEQTRLSSAQSADVARQEDRMKAIDAAGAASQASSGDLDMLRALSRTVGTTSPWTQMTVGGTRVQDWITKFHLGTDEFVGQMGNQQAYEAALNKIIIGLRQGVSMGNLSDRDLDFFKNQVPDLMKQPETRENIINFLDQAHQRKVDYARLVNKYYRPGTVSVADAEDRANTELGPLLKQPPSYTNLPPEARAPAQRLWLYKNIQPGSFFKDSSGKLKPYNPPPDWKPDGADDNG